MMPVVKGDGTLPIVAVVSSVWIDSNNRALYISAPLQDVSLRSPIRRCRNRERVWRLDA